MLHPGNRWRNLETEDLETGETVACPYESFPDQFGFFLQLAGITTVKQVRESSFDICATSHLNRLYMELLADNPDWGHGRAAPRDEPFYGAAKGSRFIRWLGQENFVMTKRMGGGRLMQDRLAGHTTTKRQYWASFYVARRIGENVSAQSRALMFITLNKLHNPGLKQAIIVVSEKSIGSSFNDEPLSEYDF
ncbi:type IIL restriction-modification enzyme MmeI [Vreelandella alkaliphila]|uniref:type IIL restriction-modification enzyme MmeI n=1 Tax=Vreelandella alkaliphila TaxID=272774 RepID=UPI00197AFDCE|nr:type IIL restriction-modification enzyme MmeI [Halomonas alkaliphila]